MVDIQKLAQIAVGKMVEITKPLHQRICALEESVAQLTGKPVPRASAASDPELGTLKARVAELEKSDQQREYRGVWERHETYHKHNMTTHDGSLWLCVRDNPPGEPGQAESGWKMVAKKGRDAPRR